MKNFIVVGLTGKLGAGKDTVADYLVSKRSFKKYNCSDILREILKDQGREQSIKNLKAVGNQLRNREGHGTLAIRLLQKIEKEQAKKAIIVGLRHPMEVETLKKQGALIINVDTPLEIRYQRIIKRGDEKDNISFEDFEKQEEQQLSGSGYDLNITKCIEMADTTVDNGNGYPYLFKQVNVAVTEVMIKTL